MISGATTTLTDNSLVCPFGTNSSNKPESEFKIDNDGLYFGVNKVQNLLNLNLNDVTSLRVFLCDNDRTARIFFCLKDKSTKVYDVLLPRNVGTPPVVQPAFAFPSSIEEPTPTAQDLEKKYDKHEKDRMTAVRDQLRFVGTSPDFHHVMEGGY